MSLVDKIKALFKPKPKVVEEKPPEATEEKVVVKPKRKRKEGGVKMEEGSNQKDASRVPALEKEVTKKDAP